MTVEADRGPALTAVLVTHRRAPLAVLERMPRGAALPAALAELVRELPAAGAVGVSTCNRFELYLEAGAELDRAALCDRLHRLTGVPARQLSGCVEVLHGDRVVQHLFGVAGGLDSRLVGEEEILGQVRAAAREADAAGTATPRLRALFQWAVRSARHARRSAGLSEERVSLAGAAVEELDRRLHPLAGRTVVVLGAGHMAGRVLAALRAAEARPILLVRRPEAVVRSGVPVLGMDELPRAIDGADAVLCATSAPRPLLSADLLRRTAARRGYRPPLVVIDLAVPRNVEAPPSGTAGICVLDLDALCGNEAGPGFEASARRALEVVTAEAAAFAARSRQAGAGPLIEQVLRHGEAIRRAELARVARLAPAIDPRVLDELTARVVQKVLHAPIAAIRQHAGAGDTDLAALIARTLAGEPADDLAQGSVQV